jgi:hypothetical protein
MKWLPWILVVLLSVALLFSWYHPKEKQDTDLVPDTVTQIDTVRDTVPRSILVRFDHWDTIYIPLLVDSGLIDTIPFTIPIEKKEYRTEEYHAVISGYKPELDLMEVFRKTQTITLKPTSKRWGLGLQAGYGVPDGWYVGVGISWILFMW